jgi:hypothetical protein
MVVIVANPCVVVATTSASSLANIDVVASAPATTTNTAHVVAIGAIAATIRYGTPGETYGEITKKWLVIYAGLQS